MSGSPPLVLPRGLIFLASLWLIGSWLVTIGVETPVQPVSASYTPGVRMMLICLAIGVTVAWPMLRLSQIRTPYAIASTMLDAIVLLALIQVVIWPLRLVTPWSVSRTVALDATLGAWLLLCAAVVAAAIGSSRPGVRHVAMMTCLAISLAGPALAVVAAMFGLDAGRLILLSPVMSVYDLCGAAGAPPTSVQWGWIAVVGAAAFVAWLTVLTASILNASRRHNALDPSET